ncbi:MAG: flavin reductase family protein [Rhizobiaceae bacterium]|nr:flavin reductase family protein [Rhizobiaceae bacterium]
MTRLDNDTLVFESDKLTSDQAYKLISATVTPRPIAWVSSRNGNGTVNLAPFSSYTFISYTPPKVLISVGPGTESLKDTLVNVGDTGEFCVNAVTQDLLEPVVNSAYAFPPDASEAAELRVAMQPSRLIGTPFIADAVIAMECRLDRIIDVGDLDAHRLIVGTVVCFHVREAVWQGDRIDPSLYRPLGRIGGPLYVTRGDMLNAPTPRTRPAPR